MASPVEEDFVEQEIKKLPPSSNILEFGCGENTFPNKISNLHYNVTAIDLFDRNVYSKKKVNDKNIKFIKGDFELIDLPTNNYDCIYALSSFEHIGLETNGILSQNEVDIKISRIINKFKNILKANGILLITVPFGNYKQYYVNRDGTWSYNKNNNTRAGTKVYDINDIYNTFKDFTIEKQEHYLRISNDYFYKHSWIKVNPEKCYIKREITDAIVCLKMTKRNYTESLDTTTTQFQSIKIAVNRNDATGKIIINGGIPEKNAFTEFTKHIKNDSIIIDIGACYGQYALICANTAKLVIAIEPNPYHFKLLKKGIELNNIKNIIALNVALSDYQGTSKLFMCNNHLEGATLYEGKLKQELKCYPDKEINVNVTTLDKILDELNIDHDKIDMIKMDAEGAELKIIKGMNKVINQSKNLKLLTEFAASAIFESGENGKDFMEFLVNKFSDVKMISENNTKKIRLSKDNIEKYSNISCTSIFCEN